MICAPEAAGDIGRTGGVPNLGGDDPYELERAAARADTPGPAPGRTAEGVPAPASGVRLPGTGDDPFRGGTELGATGGVPNPREEVIGEAKRAVVPARGAEVPRNFEPRYEPWGDEDTGTPKGRDKAGDSLPESDILA